MAMASRALLLVSLALPLACSSAPERPAASGERTGVTYAFDYATLDGARLSSTTTRGRRTVLVVLTTYDLVSQIVAREVASLARTETPRINAGFVFLEPPKNQPLVEAFVTSLEVTLPVAMADAATLGGRGPFG